MSNWTLFFVALCFVPEYQSQRIRLNAKELLRGKVMGRGYSVAAKSLGQCIEYCNKQQTTCDGVVYHDIIGKCRLINKCAPVRHIDSVQSAVYYSKRPQIKAPGYVYDSRTDSCVGLIVQQLDYASADRACASFGGNLAVIDNEAMSEIIRKVVRNSPGTWAWIEENNRVGSKRPHGVSGNDVASEEQGYAPHVVQERSKQLKSCWGVNKFGEWGQFSCKNTTLPALCQVPQFVP